MTFLRHVCWATFFLLATIPLANAADPLTPAQQDAVRQIVHEYLINNPEVLIEALHAYQARATAEAQKKQEATLSQLRQQLERDPTSPVAGNPNGDVTLVEFLDYRCAYCKAVFPEVQKLLKEDGDIRYVVKEYPILTPESVVAAKAALAVWRTAPGKYMAFHTALMTAHGALTDQRILDIAGDVGLNAKAVAAAMKAPEINAIINKNRELARSLDIRGTPAFIIGGHLIPGAVSFADLQKLVKAARKG